LIHRVRREHRMKRKRYPTASGSLGPEEEEVGEGAGPAGGGLPKFYHRPANLDGHKPAATTAAPSGMADDAEVGGIPEETDSMHPEEDEDDEEARAADSRAHKHQIGEYTQKHGMLLALVLCI
jgi:hypothetical protein